MGVRMPQARLESTGKPVFAKEYSKDQGPVQCISCSIPVCANSAYESNHKNKQSVTPAYFRRWPKRQHTKDCEFNVKVRLKRIVRRSHEVTKLDARFIALLKGTESGAELRMHVLTRNVLNQHWGNDNEKIGIAYEQSEKALKMYIRDTRAFLEVMANPVLREELERRLSFKYDDQTLSWSQLFFAREEYVRLCLSLNQVSPQDLHPVFVEIETTGRYRETRSGSWMVLSSHADFQSDSGVTVPIYPTVFCESEKMANYVSNPPGRVLICAIPKLSENRGNIYIALNVFGRRQIAKYEAGGLRPRAATAKA